MCRGAARAAAVSRRGANGAGRRPCRNRSVPARLFAVARVAGHVVEKVLADVALRAAVQLDRRRVRVLRVEEAALGGGVLCHELLLSNASVKRPDERPQSEHAEQALNSSKSFATTSVTRSSARFEIHGAIISGGIAAYRPGMGSLRSSHQLERPR